MTLLTEFPSVVNFIEHDVLKGHEQSRLLIFAAGTEQFTCNNVSSYDPVAGRINFIDVLNANARVFICD